MDPDDHAESTIGKLIQATFGLWNALLTVNGIMLTVFTAVYAIAPAGGTYLVRLLITCCVVSVCLLVFNHAAMKSTYLRMGEVMANAERPLTAQERERDIRRSLWRHKAVRISENVSMVLFVFEVVLVVSYTYSLPSK